MLLIHLHSDEDVKIQIRLFFL